MNAGTGEAEQVALANPESHGWKAGGSAVVLGQFLVEADVALGIIMGEDGPHPAQEDGNALVPTRESMVEVLENGEVLTVLLKGLQGLGHLVIRARLVGVGKKGLLVDAVVVREADEAFHRLARLAGGRAWGIDSSIGKATVTPAAFRKFLRFNVSCLICWLYLVFF